MFDLNNVQESKTQTNGTLYQKPGLDENVVITEVILDKTSLNSVPYMQLKTKSSDGAVSNSSKMFFGTSVKEGKKMSGWDVSAKNISRLICATHNVDIKTSKELFGTPNTPEEIVAKVSSLLVGRPFRGKFKGEQSPTNGKIYASLDSAESIKVPKAQSRLSFDPERDIKMVVNGASIMNPSEVVAGDEKKDDLPF